MFGKRDSQKQRCRAKATKGRCTTERGCDVLTFSNGATGRLSSRISRRVLPEAVVALSTVVSPSTPLTFGGLLSFGPGGAPSVSWSASSRWKPRSSEETRPFASSRPSRVDVQPAIQLIMLLIAFASANVPKGAKSEPSNLSSFLWNYYLLNVHKYNRTTIVAP